MERIKSVLSHGPRKSTDASHENSASPIDSTQRTSPTTATALATGQGSHFASASGNKTEHHPIYDQMTANDHPSATTSAEHAGSTEAPPHFSNAPNLKQPPSATAHPTAVSPTTASSQSGVFNEGASTASIKSGVIGYPQGEDSHAALNRSQHHGATFENRAIGQDRTQPSSLAKDNSLGTSTAGTAGTVGAAGAAETARQLHHQKDHENLRASSSQQPFEQSFQQPEVATDTDRSFPLAGGVTSRKQNDDPSLTHHSQPQAPLMGEREFGTKDRDAYVDNSHGNVLGSEHQLRSGHDHKDTLGNNNSTGGFTGSSAAPHISSDRDQDATHNRAALAAAATAASAHSSGFGSRSAPEHEHGGHGHTFSGDPCENHNQPSATVFTSGPHATDTANMLDPHLHIPGEFPETPAETPLDQKTGTSGYIGESATRQQDFGSNLPDRSGEQSHHGRDAAIAGGLGAAGIGGYAASKHHQEPTDIGSAPIASEASPYSSTKLDPRVNPQSTNLQDQHFDPVAHKEPSPLNSQQGTAAVPAQTQGQNPDHHYARNAGIVGAGAGLVGAGAAAHHYSTYQDRQESQTGPASSTIGPHSSNVANVLDPRVQPDPALQKHHQARSTAEDPASKTVGPHDSNVANVLDPRVLPQPEKQKGHTTSGPHTSDTFNRLDPNVDSSRHHDTALAGSTGVAGLGANEIAQKYDEHRSTGPSASMNDQRYDPTAAGAHDPNQTGQHHYGRDAALVGAAGAGAGAYAASRQRDNIPQQPTSSQNDHTISGSHEPSQAGAHHYGRDAALVGGVGAAGAGAYAASKHGDNVPQQTISQSHPHAPSSQGYSHPASAQGYPQSTVPQAYPTTSTYSQSQGQPQGQHGSQDLGHQRYDSVQHPEDQDHTKRNVATLGAAGLVGAGGAYAYSQRDAEKAEKERLAQEKAHQKATEKELEHQRKEQQKAQQKEFDHQRKDQQKELDHKLKEQDKAFKDEQHRIEKQQARDQKQHDKLFAAGEANRQRELEQEQPRRSDSLEKEEGGKEKKHHLFGFLHRDKERHSRSNESSPRNSREYAGTGAVAGGLAAHEAAHESDSSDGKKRRNKLHKDPPQGHPAREALEHRQAAGKREHMGTDGAIGRSDQISGDHETRTGVYGAHPIDERQGNTVTEPHTGLPMNVGKYGDGQGGTDGSPTIRGYQQDQGIAQQQGGYHQGQGTLQQGGYYPDQGATQQQGGSTDWEGVRKSNTPY